MENVENVVNESLTLNYIVLQNLAKIQAGENAGVSIVSKIFDDGQSDRDNFMDNYHKFAEMRNKYFSESDKFFNAEEMFETFKFNAQCLIDLYNEVTGKSLDFEEVFSDRDIGNQDKFNEMLLDVQKLATSGKSPMFEFMMIEFLVFYQNYEEWLSAYEIFLALQDDITVHGNKSFYYNKPKSESVKVLTENEFLSLTSEIEEIVNKKFPEYGRKNKKKKKEPSTEQEFVEDTALTTMAMIFTKFNNRFIAANTSPIEQGDLLHRIRFKISAYSKDMIKIDSIYVHVNELKTLVSAMMVIPELEDIAARIANDYLGADIKLTQIIENENT